MFLKIREIRYQKLYSRLPTKFETSKHFRDFLVQFNGLVEFCGSLFSNARFMSSSVWVSRIFYSRLFSTPYYCLSFLKMRKVILIISRYPLISLRASANIYSHGFIFDVGTWNGMWNKNGRQYFIRHEAKSKIKLNFWWLSWTMEKMRKKKVNHPANITVEPQRFNGNCDDIKNVHASAPAP